MKKNLLPVKVGYVILQGLFLPLLLCMGNWQEFLGIIRDPVFAIYTVLVLVDAYIGILIFAKR